MTDTTKPTGDWIALTDEDRERAIQSMPDMLDGFLKTWGWLHFAKAIEAICEEKNRRPSPSVHRQASAGQEGVLTGAEIDTLIALVELGPLADGDVPSKSGRDSLVARGLAARILVHGQDGYQAATYAGREAYQSHYGAETTEEATANRITTRTIRNARKDAQ